MPKAGRATTGIRGTATIGIRILRGKTTVHGFDTKTGAYWNATVEPDGDMRGYDSNYNPWSYDSRTGYYYNFGTGENCIGKGYVRTCYWGGVLNGPMGRGNQ